MSAEQKSLKDVCDLLEELINGGGVSPTDILAAINYISQGQTYSLKTVVSELSESNTDTNTDLQIALGQLFSGDDLIFGKSLLYDANSSQTAAQLLAEIFNILQTMDTRLDTIEQNSQTAAQLLAEIFNILQTMDTRLDTIEQNVVGILNVLSVYPTRYTYSTKDTVANVASQVLTSVNIAGKNAKAILTNATNRTLRVAITGTDGFLLCPNGQNLDITCLLTEDSGTISTGLTVTSTTANMTGDLLINIQYEAL